MGKKVPLKLEDGTVIGSAVISEHGRKHIIDATIDTSTPLGKKIRDQLTKGLIEGLSFDQQDESVLPIIKKEMDQAWKNDLLRLTPPRTS